MKNLMTLARKAFGLALVVAAMSGVALAVDPGDVPEMDPGSVASAMTLLTGGLLWASGRRRRS